MINVNRTMQKLLTILVCFTCLIACKKDKAGAEKNVEFYLLESYQLVTGKCQVDPSTTRLQNSALVSNDDILWYDESDHEYRLTTSAVQKINGLQGRTPFAVTVDKQIIYLGIYMPPIMSSTCEHSITMYASTQANTAYMMLGYPGWIRTPGTSTINDQRNDASLLAALKAQGKLR